MGKHSAQLPLSSQYVGNEALMSAPQSKHTQKTLPRPKAGEHSVAENSNGVLGLGVQVSLCHTFDGIKTQMPREKEGEGEVHQQPGVWLTEENAASKNMLCSKQQF